MELYYKDMEITIADIRDKDGFLKTDMLLIRFKYYESDPEKEYVLFIDEDDEELVLEKL